MKQILKKVRLKMNKFGNRNRNKKLKTNFTLISNNCWAGITYEYFGMPFISPTIGLYIFPKDYIKFISNLKHYMNIDLKFIDFNTSKYREEIVKANQEGSIIGILEDVEIIFLHYKNEKEVLEKWNRRKSRIDYNHILYKFNDQNFCTEEDLINFHNLPLKNKICFTAKKYEFDEFIQIVKYKDYEYVKSDLYCYHKYFDIINYLNERA